MAQKLPPYAIFDFTGGVRNDKSDYQKEDNELVSVRNFEINEIGRMKKRRGSHAFGDSPNSSEIINSFYFERRTLGSAPSTFHIVATDDAPSQIHQIVGSRITANVATTDTTISVDDSSVFAGGGGNVEIEGDIIAYTGTSGGNTLTGVTGITSAHNSGTAVHQKQALSGTGPTGTSGIYFAVLNNLLMINGRAGSVTFDGTSMTAISDADEAAGIFATVYRQRVYVAGDGSTDASGNRNGARNRISFTEPGDATNWGDNTVNFFDVEDEVGAEVTGQKVSRRDELLIFKMNSFFAYNETSLKPRSNIVGAYNNFVIQEIDGLIYTFCPNGVYVTNGFESDRISDPVKNYIKDFRPTRETGSIFNRVVVNTFAAQFDKKYILYIGDVTTPGSISDVSLVYDTIRKRWTVWNGFTNFTHLIGMPSYKFGGQTQNVEGLFGGDNSGEYFNFFSKTFLDVDDNIRFQGSGDLITDLVNDTGNVITATLETKLIDQGFPNIYKNYSNAGIRVLAENIGFQVSYRIENKKRVSEYRPLGVTTATNQRFEFPKEAEGFRIGLQVGHNDSNSLGSFNGFILEDVELTNKKKFPQ